MYTLELGNRDRLKQIATVAEWIVVVIGALGIVAIIAALVFPFRLEQLLTWIFLKLSGGFPPHLSP